MRTPSLGKSLVYRTVRRRTLALERDGYVRARDRSGFYVTQPLSRVVDQPRGTSAIVPPVPVGISELAADVLRQLGDRRSCRWAPRRSDPRSCRRAV
jgi:hypothetical protein